jgi:hypothetical protein
MLQAAAMAIACNDAAQCNCHATTHHNSVQRLFMKVASVDHLLYTRVLSPVCGTRL